VAKQHAPDNSPLATVVEGVINNLGQQLAICMASTIRELLLIELISQYSVVFTVGMLSMTSAWGIFDRPSAGWFVLLQGFPCGISSLTPASGSCRMDHIRFQICL
jgi:Na+-transporting NADH:ubiquinone oxidoreductase subunit NqrD